MTTFLIIFGILELITIFIVIVISTTEGNSRTLGIILGLLTFGSFVLSLLIKLLWWIITMQL